MALTACGGGGGGDSSTPNNLSAKSIRIVTPDPKIAYPLDVSVNITADVAAKDVPVSVFAVDNTTDPNADVRQLQLGTVTIPQVNAGNGDYTVSVTIPSSVATSGNYYISAIVDPANVISETNEDDNTVYVESSISPKGNPNVKITDLNTDRLAMLLNTDPWSKQVTGTTYTDTYTNAQNEVVNDVIPNTHNTNAGATITVSADGLATGDSIDIEAKATLKVVRTDNDNAEIDVPLYLWNSDGGSFTDTYGTGAYGSTGQWVPIGTYNPQLVNYDAATEESALDDVKAHKIELGFYFPDTLADFITKAVLHPPSDWNAWANTMKSTARPPDLTQAAMNTAIDFIKGIAGAGDEAAALANMQISLCVEIQPTNTGDADTTDNKLCKPLDISLPPDPAPVDPPAVDPHTIDASYPKTGWTTQTNPIEIGGNYDGKGGGSVFGYGPLDFGAGISQDNRGYIQEARGVIPLTIFGTPIEFMNALARAQLVPNYAGKPSTETTGYRVELSFLGVMLYSKNEASSRTDSITFSKEAPDPEKEQQYFVGPVPVVAGASVTGNIGIEFEYGFSNDDGTHGPLNFGSTVTPFANVEASMHAGVGTVVFSAGVEGMLTLLDERLPLFVGGTYLTVHDDGFSSGNVDFEVNQGATLSNVFTGPQGTISLYAKYSKPKLVTCTWPFGIKGKCLVIKSVKVSTDIWRSPALFKLNDILLEAPVNQFEVVIMSGQDPVYYTP